MYRTSSVCVYFVLKSAGADVVTRDGEHGEWCALLTDFDHAAIYESSMQGEYKGQQGRVVRSTLWLRVLWR